MRSSSFYCTATVVALTAGLLTRANADEKQLYRTTVDERSLQVYRITSGAHAGNYQTCEGDLIEKSQVERDRQPIPGECPSAMLRQEIVPRGATTVTPAPPSVVVINGEAPIPFDDVELDITSGEPTMTAATPAGHATDNFARTLRVMSATVLADLRDQSLLIQTPRHNLKLGVGRYILDGVESKPQLNLLIVDPWGFSVRLIPVLRLLGATVWTSKDHLYVLY